MENKNKAQVNYDKRFIKIEFTPTDISPEDVIAQATESNNNLAWGSALKRDDVREYLRGLTSKKVLGLAKLNDKADDLWRFILHKLEIPTSELVELVENLSSIPIWRIALKRDDIKEYLINIKPIHKAIDYLRGLDKCHIDVHMFIIRREDFQKYLTDISPKQILDLLETEIPVFLRLALQENRPDLFEYLENLPTKEALKYADASVYGGFVADSVTYRADVKEYRFSHSE